MFWVIFHHSSQKNAKNQLLIILINKLMNNGANTMDSQSIWLKLVRSKLDWLDLTNPWLKKVIWIDPNFIFSILYRELRPLSLLHTCGLSWKLCGLMCQYVGWRVSSINSWLTSRLSGSSVQLQIGINGLSFNCSGLFPWDLRPPWAGSPIFCINKKLKSPLPS